MTAWLAAESDRDAMLPAYRAVFFTDQGQLRKALATPARDQAPARDRGHPARESERLECARGVALVELTVALLRLGLDITQRYAAAQRAAAGSTTTT
jgi:ATP-dependent helicase/nuclease subunit A